MYNTTAFSCCSSLLLIGLHLTFFGETTHIQDGDSRCELFFCLSLISWRLIHLSRCRNATASRVFWMCPQKPIFYAEKPGSFLWCRHTHWVIEYNLPLPFWFLFCILMCNPHNHILLLFSLTSVFDMLPSFPIKLSSTHCRNAFSTFTKMKQRDTPSLNVHNSGIFQPILKSWGCFGKEKASSFRLIRSCSPGFIRSGAMSEPLAI